jgi:gliding motility-associated-like protein
VKQPRLYQTILRSSLFAILLSAGALKAQLSVTPVNNGNTLAQNLVGSGVLISNVTLSCANNAAGTFTANNTNLGLTGGILLTTGWASVAVGPNNSGSAGVCNGGGSDPVLTQLAGISTFDACRLEFDFVPTSNNVSFQYVFGSEEYPEFANSSFNDAFAFLISGPNPSGGNYNNVNIATLPNGQIVSINSVNHIVNNQFYINNNFGQTIQYDGFTVILTATANVVPCQTYRLRLSIADGLDCAYDSGVFLASGSFVSGNFNASVSSIVPATCSSGGSASVTATGGIPPYTYTWSNGQTGPTANNLNPGNYTVTVSYTQCNQPVTTQVSVTIPGPQPVSAQASTTPVSCANGTNGSIQLNVTGGTAPYTAQWNNGSTGLQINNLAAGTYTATINDAGGCSTTVSATITQPNPVIINTLGQVSPSCAGVNNGSIQVAAIGGTGNLTYLWQPSGATSAQNPNLAGGQHSVVVTDANGCTAQQSFNLITPVGIVANISSITNVACNGQATGAIQSQISGGTQPLTFNWSPQGGNTQNATNLPAGNYTLSIADANGCTASLQAQITQPPPLQLPAPQVNNIPCNGQANGSIQVNPQGGVGPYFFLWTPGGSNQSGIQNLSPGTYSVMVSDANGCIANAAAQITQPNALSLQLIQPTSPTCHNETNGNIGSQVSGGTAPYVYQWTPSGQNTPQITGLGAGNFGLTVSDANGCLANAQTTLINPPALQITQSSITHVLCNGASSGAIQTAVSGGTTPYQFTWNGSASPSSSIQNIPAGTYTLAVTDANGCPGTFSAQINQPTALVVAPPAVSPVICNGQTNGSLNTQASGGVAPYQFTWQPGNLNGALQGNLPAGTYTLNVVDANGCTQQQTATITQPQPLLASISQINNVTCNGNANGSLTATASGGNGGFSYQWTPSGGNQLSASNLGPGNYTFTVTDSKNCTATASATITQPAPLQIQQTQLQNVTCNGLANGSIQTSVSGGTPAYQYQWNGQGSPNPGLQNLAPGTYNLQVSDANGCQAIFNATITQPTPLLLPPAIVSDVLCNGDASGKITVQPSGGTPAYTFNWSPGGNAGAELSGITSGTYQLTLTDANGCGQTQQITVNQPAPIQLQTNQDKDSICAGEIVVFTGSASGGTAPFQSNWNGNNGTQWQGSPAQSGVWNFGVTDANGCTAQQSRSIRVGGLPQAQFTPPSGCEQDALTFLCQSAITAGEGQIQIRNWNVAGNLHTGATYGYAFNQSGVYPVTLTVQTSFGCIDSITNWITIHPSPQVSFLPSDFQGCAPLCVRMENLSQISSGITVQWQWEVNGQPASQQHSPTLCFDQPGTYSIGLHSTSDQGCKAFLFEPNLIQVGAPPIADFRVSESVLEITDAFVQFTNESFQANTFHWNFGDGNSSAEMHPGHVYQEPGEYCITLNVTSPEGCTDSKVTCLKVIPVSTYYIPNSFTPNGDGINDEFRVHGMGIVEMKMLIFNRWGELLFESDIIDRGWTGNVKGNSLIKAKQDVYTYRIEVRDLSGRWKEFIGQVNLIR